MAARSAVRNRSPIVDVTTPRGRIQVARQEMKGLRRGSGWTWFWIARRAGKQDWSEATTAKEAIRKATLLPPRKHIDWLDTAATAAEHQIAQESDGKPPSTDDLTTAKEGVEGRVV